jgi:uncharacterized protein YukE
VADKLKVDPVALHLGSNQMFDAIGEASLEFVSHEDGLADAAPGWIGSSQVALGELPARWEARHSQHKLKVGGLGSHVADVMVSYVTTEDESTRTLRSVQEQGSWVEPLTPADVKRWDLGAIHSVFETASGRADSLRRLGDNLQQVHNTLNDWQGEAGEAFRVDVGQVRRDIESDGTESKRVAAAVSHAETECPGDCGTVPQRPAGGHCSASQHREPL